MRSVAEYLERAADFDRLAAAAQDAVLKRRYTDVAECLRLLAIERERPIAEGSIEPETPP